MLKVLFNQDGSINQLIAPQYVVQGSSGELDSLRIEAKVVDLDLTDYIVTAQCKLPNNHTSSIDLDGVTEEGYRYGYLTEAQTYYDGTLLVSVRIEDENENVLYSFNVPVTINPSTYGTEGVSDNITNAQYVDLVKQLSVANAKIDKLSAVKPVIYYDTYNEAIADVENLEIGQIVWAQDRRQLFSVYIPSGLTTKTLSGIHVDSMQVNYSSESERFEMTEDQRYRALNDPYSLVIYLYNPNDTTYSQFMYRYVGFKNGQFHFVAIKEDEEDGVITREYSELYFIPSSPGVTVSKTTQYIPATVSMLYHHRIKVVLNTYNTSTAIGLMFIDIYSTSSEEINTSTKLHDWVYENEHGEVSAAGQIDISGSVKDIFSFVSGQYNVWVKYQLYPSETTQNISLGTITDTIKQIF